MKKYLPLLLIIPIALGIASVWLTSPKPVAAQATFGPFQCSNNFAISGTASLQLVTAADTSSFIYICAFMVGTPGTAESGSVVEGTGTTCATNTKAVIGATTSAGFPIGASPVQQGGGVGFIAKTQVAGDNLCLLVSGAAAIGGNVTYAQQHF